MANDAWVFNAPIEFMFLPGGLHCINANFGSKGINLHVHVNPDTAKTLQRSFDILATEKGELLGDESHEGGKATLRFRRGETRFRWGCLRGNEGVICEGGRPTTLGVQLANGFVLRSWSPEFHCDCDYGSAVERDGVLYFPAGARGSPQNPAKVTGLGDCFIGALCNSPAFKSMPTLQAALAHDPRLRPLFDRIAAADATVQRLVDRGNREKLVEFLAESKTKGKRLN
jgi:hypothetical protein